MSCFKAFLCFIMFKNFGKNAYNIYMSFKIHFTIFYIFFFEIGQILLCIAKFRSNFITKLMDLRCKLKNFDKKPQDSKS